MSTLLSLLLIAWAAAPAAAQVELTMDPGRSRGPVLAPVTIVEFSDFE
jgi:hypothetical protein